MTTMTTAQLLTLKNAINADANIAASLAAGDHGAIAAYYNGAGINQLWRPDILPKELVTAVVWSDFVALTAIKQNGFLAMVMCGLLDATNANIRAGFTAIFGGGSTSLTNLTALAKRTSTKFEDLYTTSNVCALYGYTVTSTDVAIAIALGS